MSQSVEVRVPFLDHILAGDLLSPGQNKGLLKKVLRNQLPEAILNRKKRGFVFPIADWLKSVFKSNVEELLLDGNGSVLGLSLDSSETERIWKEFLNGRVHWSQPWSLYVLKKWQNKLSSLCVKGN